nr:hypothetical protein [Tanacetum cinerariifolium]
GTLHEAYGLAKIQNLNNTTLENKLTSAKRGATHPKNTNETGRVTPPVNASKLPLLPTPNTRPIGATTTKTGAKVSRRLTSKELELKQAKGECFWCTEKFVPGHKCPRNQLFIIKVKDEDEAYEENKEYEEDKIPQISIHALTGLPSYSTMRIRGAMGNRQLHILVDGKPCELKGIQTNVSLCSMEKVDSLLQKHNNDGSIQLYSLQLTTLSLKLMHHSNVNQDQVQGGVTLPWQELVDDFQ